MVSLVNRDINLVSSIRKVNVNTMISMVIRVMRWVAMLIRGMQGLVWLAG